MSWYAGFEHIVREGEVLAPFTDFRLGGPASFFAEPTSVDELSGLLAAARAESIPVRLLGGGSNVLVPDEGYDGLVLQITAPAFTQIQVDGTRVTAGGGSKLVHLISTTAREGLSGLEQLAGIRGTVGGALKGNAGTGSGDIGQWTESVSVMTVAGEVLDRSRDEIHFSYRQSNLDEAVILAGVFQLDQDDAREVTRRIQKLWIMKRASHPMGEQGSGSVFKDQGGVSAASLIEQAGFKDAQVGGATVFESQANYIVVGDGATSADVRRLIDKLREGVLDQLEVELQLQVDLW